MVDEASGTARFQDFVRDERQMAMLFQHFVFNFLRREQQDFKVSSPQIRWKDVDAEPEDMAFLPIMQTDIVLTSPSRQVIIDTKFYREALQARFAQPKIRATHLYQIDSYLTNAEVAGGPAMEGVLLYPAVETEFALRYRLRGRPVQVRSINLAQPWDEIRKSLLDLAAA